VGGRRGFCPRVGVDGRGEGAVSQAGGVLLVRTVRPAGLDVPLSEALASWRKPTQSMTRRRCCWAWLPLRPGLDCQGTGRADVQTRLRASSVVGARV
jgi:hypothetical protein